MVDYCMAPDHVNDEVDLAIMSRNTLRNSGSLESMCNPLHAADRETPWETTVNKDGKWVSGKEAMDRWTEQWPMIEYVCRRGEGGLAEPLNELYTMSNADVQVPLNKVGEYISRNANVEQLLRTVLFDDVHGLNPLSVHWINFLGVRGYDEGPEITAIGTENNPEAQATIWYLTLITANKHLGKLAEANADKLGINTYEGRLAYKISAMLHEIGHNRGVDSEYTIGLLMSEFYNNMAKKCKGSEKEKIYKALAKESAEYAEGHKPSGFLKYLEFYKQANREGFSEAQLRELVARYESEGKSKGYTGNRLSDYVSRRLKEESKEESAECQDRPNKAANKGKKSKENKQDNEEAQEQDGQEDGSDAEPEGESPKEGQAGTESSSE